MNDRRRGDEDKKYVRIEISLCAALRGGPALCAQQMKTVNSEHAEAVRRIQDATLTL